MLENSTVEFRLMFNISVNQASDNLLGISMKLIDEMSRRLTVSKTLATFLVLFNRNAANLFKQIGLTIGHEQDLELTEVAKFFSGSASADTALVATQTVEKTFE